MVPSPARRLTVNVALVCGVAASSVSLAQNNKTTPEPALKGPQVTDRNVPGAAPDFGMGANRRFGDRVPPDIFRRAFNVLTDEDVSDEVRATPAQRAKFKELIEGFEDSVKKYRQEHAKEMEELRKAAGEVRGGRPGARRQQREEQMTPDEDLTSEQQKARDTARAKLRELTAGAPKMEDVYTKVWTELTEPQRKAVQAELDEWRDEQAKRREDEYVRRQMNQKDAAGGGAPRPAGRPNAPARANPPSSDDAMMAPKPDSMIEDREEARKDDGKKEDRKEARNDDRPDARKDKPDADAPRMNARRDRLLRLFSQLTPEEQEQLLQRLEDRLQDRRRPNAAPRRAEPKPPADPDQVKVPKPDDEKQ